MQKNILLAGEKRENSLPLSLFLEGRDFCVVVEEECDRILDKFQNRQNTNRGFDLLIAGTQLPEDRFLGMAEELRRLEIQVPLIRLSNDKEAGWVNCAAGQYGDINVYVVKLSESAELIKTVQQLLKPRENEHYDA